MTEANPIGRLLQSARRRTAAQELALGLSFATAIALGAFLLLIVLGTQVLRWWWPVLLLAGASLWGAWRAMRALPDDYLLAQRLDSRCGLQDLLSSAFHFSQHRDSARNAGLVDLVTRQAEEAAGRVRLDDTMPWAMSRASWVSVAMLVAVLAAFGLRYGMLRTFDLTRPLLAVNLDPLTGAPVNATPEARKMAQKGPAPDLPGFTLPEADRAQIEENERAIEEQLKTFDIQDPNQAGPQGQGEKGRPAQSPQQQEEGTTGEQSSEGSNPTLSSGNEDSKPGGNQKQAAKPPEKNSLLDKMRDAMANLMDKLKSDNGNSEPQEASSKSGESKGEGQQQAQGQKGSQSQGKQTQSEQGDPQEGNQPSDADAQNAQMAKGNQAQEPPSNNPKSGVGKSDGRKDTELAEQLEAMGKISEILSKRAEKIQGEMMVEVTNTKNQQARTPYSNRKGTHTESGGELTRDEVPLHLQHYVQKYYESVRKPVPAPPSGAKQ